MNEFPPLAYIIQAVRALKNNKNDIVNAIMVRYYQRKLPGLQVLICPCSVSGTDNVVSHVVVYILLVDISFLDCIYVCIF